MNRLLTGLKHLKRKNTRCQKYKELHAMHMYHEITEGQCLLSHMRKESVISKRVNVFSFYHCSQAKMCFLWGHKNWSGTLMGDYYNDYCVCVRVYCYGMDIMLHKNVHIFNNICKGRANRGKVGHFVMRMSLMFLKI